MAIAFQSNAFQNSAFQTIVIANPRDIVHYLRRYLNDLPAIDNSTHVVSFIVGVRNVGIITYIRRYLNDLSVTDTSTHSVSFSVGVRNAFVVRYIRRYLNDIAPVPANALLAEDGTPILTETGDYILVE